MLIKLPSDTVSVNSHLRPPKYLMLEIRKIAAVGKNPKVLKTTPNKISKTTITMTRNGKMSFENVSPVVDGRLRVRSATKTEVMSIATVVAIGIAAGDDNLSKAPRIPMASHSIVALSVTKINANITSHGRRRLGSV